MSDWFKKLFIDEAKPALLSKMGSHSSEVCVNSWSEADKENAIKDIIASVPEAEGKSF